MKISVIIPVYNAQNYLDKSIGSVLRQTYENWELILVNDGSNDDSGIIIDTFAQQDDRIKALHQANQGPGAARNNGLQFATGEYVVFLDSDDYIEDDYFCLLEKNAKNADVVLIDVNQVNPSGEIIQKEYMSAYAKYTKDALLRAQMTGKIPWGGVRKAVKLSLLKKYNIVYTAHAIGEEALYSFKVLYFANKIEFLSQKPVYNYVDHENSQSKLRIHDPWGGVVFALSNYCKENGLYEEFANTLNAFNMTATVVSLDRIACMYEKKEINKYAKERVQELFDSYDKNYPCDKKSMSLKAKIFVPFLKRRKYKIVLFCSKLKRIIGR